jgi:hypothetical protein
LLRSTLIKVTFKHRARQALQPVQSSLYLSLFGTAITIVSRLPNAAAEGIAWRPKAIE